MDKSQIENNKKNENDDVDENQEADILNENSFNSNYSQDKEYENYSFYIDETLP